MAEAENRAHADELASRAIFDLKASDDDMEGSRAAYLVVRSALLCLAVFRGHRGAAEAAYALGDELATGGGK